MPKQSRPRGSIKQLAPGKFRIRVCTGHDAKGHYLYHDETIRGRKAEANAALTRILAKLDEGQYLRPTKKLLSEAFDEWLKLQRPKVSEVTAAWYLRIFDTHVKAKLGSTPLRQLRTEQIETLYADIAANYSPITIRHVHVVLNACLKRAVKRKLISENPAADLTRPKPAPKARRTLTPEEGARFLKACDEVPRGLIVEFALLTGMRPEEYLALQWNDLDWKKGEITVQRALVRVKGKWSFEKTKTPKSRRAIPLPPPLVTKLQRHRTAQREERMKAGPLWQDHNLIFAAETGVPYWISNMSTRVFKAVLRKAGLPDMRLYDLRHSQASLLFRDGENIKVISERLGHSSVSVTLEVYSHLLPNMQERATARLEEMLYNEQR